MALSAAIQATGRLVRRWLSSPPPTIWAGGFMVGIDVAVQAPKDAVAMSAEIRRLASIEFGTSPEVYEREIQHNVEIILEALGRGRLTATPEQSSQASVTRQGMLIVEMAKSQAERNADCAPDNPAYELEVARKMGIYLAGMILGLRLGRVHTDGGAESLIGAALDYVHRQEGGISPYLRIHLEDIEQATVKRIVTGEGFDA